MRPLNSHEINVITVVASKVEGDAKQWLLSDLKLCEVDDAISTNNIVSFVIKDYIRPPYTGQHTYGIDGYVQDSDGSKISVLLFADASGHILEMEFIRWDGKPVIDPNWASLVIDEDVTAQPLLS